MKPVANAKEAAKLALGLGVAALLVIPAAVFVLVAKVFEKADTPEDVAAVLRKCIDGAEDAEDEFDAFTSRKIADPRLDNIRADMVALASSDWGTSQTRRKFQELLSRVEAMRDSPLA
jgi:hypothetical protein